MQKYNILTLIVITLFTLTSKAAVPVSGRIIEGATNAPLAQLATDKAISIIYVVDYILHNSFMGDYGFFSHFRICLFKF